MENPSSRRPLKVRSTGWARALSTAMIVIAAGTGITLIRRLLRLAAKLKEAAP